MVRLAGTKLDHIQLQSLVGRLDDNTLTRGATDRLISLDVFREITIAGMVLVNNPGSWSHIYWPLAGVRGSPMSKVQVGLTMIDHWILDPNIGLWTLDIGLGTLD